MSSRLRRDVLKKYPSVNVRVEYRRANHVYEDVLHNAVDLGLVAYPQKNRQLEIIPFHEDHLVVICSPEHPLAKKTHVTFEELQDYKYIAFDKDIPTRKATDQVMRERKVELEPVMEFDNIETVKRAVEINAGIAIVPSVTVMREVNQGLIKKLEFQGEKLNRPLRLSIERDAFLTPAMKKLLNLLTTQDLVVNQADLPEPVAEVVG